MNRYGFLITIYVFYLVACGNQSTIRHGDYMLEGNINIEGNDTILDGTIKYFEINTGKLASMAEYDKNIKHGSAIEYYSNGSVYSNSTFRDGLLDGLATVYDSLGRLVFTKNYYHGLTLGPLIDYAEGKLKKFRFVTVEGIDLYKCEYNSANEIMELGRLLNYVTRFELEGDEMKVCVFLYLISPPHKEITYRLYQKDITSNDSTLVFQGHYETIPFKEIRIDPPKEGQVYVWEVNAFYPADRIEVKNVVPTEQRNLIVPSK